MNPLLVGLLSLVVAGIPGSATAAAAGAPVPLQRFLLVVGANAGGGDRAKLQYAISDAERFARVMVELGGVLPANEVVLKQPRLKDVLDALDSLSVRAADARRASPTARTEVIVYYSGHADEQGLLLGVDRLSYRALRDRLDRMPADVRIAVLDACASGAFTQLKGGRARPAFLVDESAEMRGHAFLTSSAATESAQESDRIRASYFTHYLISGFRGAADTSGDGKITLSEAYQFAFKETLGRTVDTSGGAQHPSYDISLSGSGDVVMTDVRQTTATLVLGEDLDGRIFVRNAARELIVEVSKPAGRRVELGVEPGAYEVRLDRPPASLTASTRVAEGNSVTLEARQFGPAAVEATRRRGDVIQPPPRFAVAGRHRIDVLLGGWSGSLSVTQGSATVDTVKVLGGLQYTVFAREDLGITFALVGRAGEVSSAFGPSGISSNGSATLSVPIGVRWNPLASRHPSSQLKPYVAATVGPVFGAAEQSFIGAGTIAGTASAQTTVGGDALLGLDFHISRWFSVGVSGGYNWMGNVSRPTGGRDNLGGAEFGFNFGFLFGKGR